MILQKVKKERLADCYAIKDVLWKRGIDERLMTCQCLWESISYMYYRTDWLELPETGDEIFKIISENTEILD
jgi:hypothetical protein